MDTDKEMVREIQERVEQLNGLFKLAANHEIMVSVTLNEFGVVGVRVPITKIEVELSKRMTY